MKHVQAFIRDCAVVALASYASVCVYFGISWESWIGARWIINGGLGNRTLLLAAVGCSLGSLIVTLAVWKWPALRDTSRIGALLLSIFLATALAELIARGVANPYPENNCWGLARSDVSSSMFLLLQPVAMSTALLVNRNAENILKYLSGGTKFGGEAASASGAEKTDR